MAYKDPDFAESMTSLGYVAGLWAALEYEINGSIWELANVAEDVGACLTFYVPSIGSRMRVYAALAHLRAVSPQVYGKINSFSSDAENTSRKRNRFVHDPYFITGEETVLRRLHVTADRKLDFSLKPAPVDAINALYEEIDKLMSRFRALHAEVIDTSPSFPREQFVQSRKDLHHRRS